MVNVSSMSSADDVLAFQRRLAIAKKRRVLLGVGAVLLIPGLWLVLLMGPVMWVCLLWTTFFAFCIRRFDRLLPQARERERQMLVAELEDPDPFHGARNLGYQRRWTARLRGYLVLSYVGVAAGIGGMLFMLGHGLGWW